MPRFFKSDPRKECDEVIRSFLSDRELFYTNYAIPSFNLPKNEQALRKRVEAPFNFLNSKLRPPARFLKISVKTAIISYQDKFEKATKFWERFLNFQRLISELSGCLLKHKALLQKNNFVTAVILVIVTLSGELRNSGEIRNSCIPPWLKTLGPVDNSTLRALSL